MTQHSTLAPSSASRRMACPGSRALEAKYPQRESEAAKEGERAHELAAKKLELPTDSPLSDVEYTEEMKEGAELYVNTLHPLTGNASYCGIEQLVDISSIALGCFGTVDFFAFNKETNTLHVVDYKFGHRYVEVFENWQLIAYAAGLLQQHPATQVVFYIIQPRSYGSQPVRTWGVAVEDLKPYFERLKASEALSMQPDAPLQPSAECMYCSARFKCPALGFAAEEAAVVATEPRSLDTELGPELQRLKKHQALLDARVSGLEEEVMFHLRAGKAVPGFRVEFVQGRERWKLDAFALEAASRIFNIDLMKKTPITPNQAIKAGLPEVWVKQQVESVQGAPKLVMDDGKAARKAFGGKK